MKLTTELGEKLFRFCEDCQKPFFRYQHVDFMKKFYPDASVSELNLLTEETACADDEGCCFKTVCKECHIQCDGCGQVEMGEYMLFIETLGVKEKHCKTCVEEYRKQYFRTDIPFFQEFITRTYDKADSYTIDFAFYPCDELQETTFSHTGNGICTWFGISQYLSDKRGW